MQKWCRLGEITLQRVESVRCFRYIQIHPKRHHFCKHLLRIEFIFLIALHWRPHHFLSRSINHRQSGIRQNFVTLLSPRSRIADRFILNLTDDDDDNFIGSNQLQTRRRKEADFAVNNMVGWGGFVGRRVVEVWQRIRIQFSRRAEMGPLGELT